MSIKKQLIAVQLILSVSLLNALCNNVVEKIIFYPSQGNYQYLTRQFRYVENETQLEYKVNFVETPGDIEKTYIEIPEQRIRIKYFDLCESTETEMCNLRVVINSSIESEFTLFKYKNDNEKFKEKLKLVEGKLKIGQNNVYIPYNRAFLRKRRHEYTLIFNNNGNEHEVKIEFNLKYDGWPEDKLHFEPETGKIALKLKSEGKKVIIAKSKLVLNRKVIIKSGLTNVILGVIILLASPKIDKLRERAKEQSVRTSIESSKRLFKTFGIGVTVYGLGSIFRSLKKTKLKGEVFKSDNEAVIYNRNLKREFEIREREWKDRIIVTVSVPRRKIMLNKEVR